MGAPQTRHFTANHRTTLCGRPITIMMKVSIDPHANITCETCKGKMPMNVNDAKPGDVLLDEKGTVWQRGDHFYNWSTFSGPVGYYGDWKPSYGPQGELTLLVRDKTPVPSVAPEGVNKPA